MQYPKSTYNVSVRVSTDGPEGVVRASPASVAVTVADTDVHGVHFIVFRHADNFRIYGTVEGAEAGQSLKVSPYEYIHPHGNPSVADRTHDFSWRCRRCSA